MEATVWSRFDVAWISACASRHGTARRDVEHKFWTGSAARFSVSIFDRACIVGRKLGRESQLELCFVVSTVFESQASSGDRGSLSSIVQYEEHDTLPCTRGDGAKLG